MIEIKHCLLFTQKIVKKCNYTHIKQLRQQNENKMNINNNAALFLTMIIQLNLYTYFKNKYNYTLKKPSNAPKFKFKF